MAFTFFKKKKPAIIPAVNYSTLTVDLHSHLIPGIDDGAQTLEQAVMLIRQLIDLGYKKIITTPHVMADYYRNTPEIILNGLALLKEELKKQQINVIIEAAAEYYLDELFNKKIDNSQLLTISNQHVLFELSFINPPQNLFETITKLQQKNYQPILAHPERYDYFFDDVDNYKHIKNTGCLLQLNILSLTGYYGHAIQKTAQRLVDLELVDFIATDLHHQRHASMLKTALKEPYIYRLLTDYPLKNQLFY